MQQTDLETPHRVFVSYSHDSTEHKAMVREFCTVLRRDAGIDVRLDQWDDDGRQDWSLWAQEQLREADFVVVIASPDYRRRAEGLAPPDEGRGAQFEATMIRDQMTKNLAEQTRRILPVVLPGWSVDEIPAFLCPYSATHYVISELTLAGTAELRAAFDGVAAYPKPERGRFAGNAYAELHARLQAEENQAASRPEAASRPGTVNSGVVHFGTHNQIGDNFVGDKIINPAVRDR
jgi:hypothetical protein